MTHVVNITHGASPPLHSREPQTIGRQTSKSGAMLGCVRLRNLDGHLLSWTTRVGFGHYVNLTVSALEYFSDQLMNYMLFYIMNFWMSLSNKTWSFRWHIFDDIILYIRVKMCDNSLCNTPITAIETYISNVPEIEWLTIRFYKPGDMISKLDCVYQVIITRNTWRHRWRRYLAYISWIWTVHEKCLKYNGLV